MRLISLSLMVLLVFLSHQMHFPHQSRNLQSLELHDTQQQLERNENKDFEEFKELLNKRYNSASEEVYRMLIFQKNSNDIENHNIKLQQTVKGDANPQKVGYFQAPNHFSDLTEKEFRLIYTKTYPTSQSVLQKSNQVIEAYQKERSIRNHESMNTQMFSFAFAPPSIDNQRESELNQQIAKIIERSQHLKDESQSQFDALLSNNSPSFKKQPITQVLSTPIHIARYLQGINETEQIEINWTAYAGSIKYQGECGSCYAFAAVQALSAMNAIYKFGFNAPLSVQQIVDCSSKGLTFGCSGGFIEGAYAYMQTMGITTNFEYQYTGRQDSCKTNGGNFKVASFRTLPQGDCRSLVEQLKKKPIAVGIAGYRLRFYSHGVFDDCNSYIDHAVLLVGYKSNLGWKIKNTWGPDWGMNGYAWIKDGNNCGICQNAVTATVQQEV